MELKRKYREIPSNDGSSVVVKSNGWLRRNLSFTGMYYRLSRYGEDLKACSYRRSYCICFYIILVDTAKYNPWKRHLKEVLRILTDDKRNSKELQNKHTTGTWMNGWVRAIQTYSTIHFAWPWQLMSLNNNDCQYIFIYSKFCPQGTTDALA